MADLGARAQRIATRSYIKDLWKRHEGDHDDKDEEEELTEDEIKAQLDEARNHVAAEAFWYTLIFLIITAFLIRLARAWVSQKRLAQREHGGPLSSGVGKLDAILRFLSASYWRNMIIPSWLALAPLDKILSILLYSSFVTLLITWKAIEHDASFLERLGFRAAWVSTTQPTLVFLLAARVNPLGLVLGVPYQRLNWLHRWASRVFFASVTVHALFLILSLTRVNYFWEEILTVGIVKWGIVVWFILLWMVVTSLVPFRRWRYEFFVAQHIASAVLLIVMLFLHVPTPHHFSVWSALVAFLYDAVTRCANPVWRNISVRLPSSALIAKVPRYAFSARAEAVDEDLTAITIRGVAFKWTPGQHVLIWSPSFRWQSPHPFTISGLADPGEATQDIQLLAKTKMGFTHKLSRWAQWREELGQHADLRLLVAGPYGSVPNWRQCTSLVLISATSGGSFTTPVLEDLITAKNPGCLQSLTALYVVRRKTHASLYMGRLARVLPLAKARGISVHVELAITEQSTMTTNSDEAGSASGKEGESNEEQSLVAAEEDGEQLQDLVRASTDSKRSTDSERSAMILKEEPDLGLDDTMAATGVSMIKETYGRPNIDALIRREVDRATGLVGIAVCAGKGIEDLVKRSIASASTAESPDIWLHVESAGGG